MSPIPFVLRNVLVPQPLCINVIWMDVSLRKLCACGYACLCMCVIFVCLCIYLCSYDPSSLTPLGTWEMFLLHSLDGWMDGCVNDDNNKNNLKMIITIVLVIIIINARTYISHKSQERSRNSLLNYI